MENRLDYKGYFTVIHYSAPDQVLYGKIEGISDLVAFDSESSSEIVKEFHEAVDDYLDSCKAIGKEPEKPFKGSFNVRITPALHRALATKAQTKGISLNQAVENAIQSYVDEKPDEQISLVTPAAFRIAN